jgi:hypothetical protein
VLLAQEHGRKMAADRSASGAPIRPKLAEVPVIGARSAGHHRAVAKGQASGDSHSRPPAACDEGRALARRVLACEVDRHVP